MKIKHIEKTTLVDYPGKIACTIFLFGCNFRCGFCYNPPLVIREETEDISKEEVLDFLDKRVDKLEGVCFTGGEALMTLEENFLRSIKEKGFSIKIDTNGSYPKKLKEFIDGGLVDYVAMDIKGTKEDYPKIIGVPNFDLAKIEESIKIISALENYEFRTTYVKRFHSKEKIEEMLKWVNFIAGKKIKKFCLQGFKNYGKFIDEYFLNEETVGQIELEEVKKEILKEGLAEEVFIRV